MTSTRKALLALAVAAAAGPAYAHHAGAIFDREKVVALSGTVKAFQWTNPHSWILLDVPDPSGKVVLWSVEAEGPGMMSRLGWTPKSLTPGDRVTVRAHPIKDGRPAGALMDVTKADGKVLRFGLPLERSGS